MIERVEQRAISEGINNIEARVADVFDLPFDTEYFDVVYMIAVIGEIPSPKLAMKEFSRVLKSSGLLAFSEILFDPDYPRAGTLIRLTSSAGFRIRRKIGNLLSYTLVFEKPECQAAEQLAGADQGCTGKKPGKSEIGYLSVVYGLVRWSKVKSWMAEILTVFDFVRSMIIGV